MEAGEAVAQVDGVPVITHISGILRGILTDGLQIPQGMKCADVDPRCQPNNCFTVSDKARSLGGAVLEAMGALGQL